MNLLADGWRDRFDVVVELVGRMRDAFEDDVGTVEQLRWEVEQARTKWLKAKGELASVNPFTKMFAEKSKYLQQQEQVADTLSVLNEVQQRLVEFDNPVAAKIADAQEWLDELSETSVRLHELAENLQVAQAEELSGYRKFRTVQSRWSLHLELIPEWEKLHDLSDEAQDLFTESLTRFDKLYSDIVQTAAQLGIHPHEHIKVAAYFIWEADGCRQGQELRCWNAAIQQLSRSNGDGDG